MTLGAAFTPGARVRAARTAAGMSRAHLGALVGHSASVIARVETDGREVSVEELRDVADACGVPEWFLVHGWEGWHESAEFRIRLEVAMARAGLRADGSGPAAVPGQARTTADDGPALDGPLLVGRVADR